MLDSIKARDGAKFEVIKNQTLTVTSYEVTECSSALHCFGLDSSVFQALMQRYSQTALAFLTQTLSFQPMNGNRNQARSLSLTLTSTPRFVDSIFILFPLTNEHRTVYLNPLLKEWTLKMGGYGQVPDISTSTTSAKFYELCANALNMNNDSQGFNEEVMKYLVLVNDSVAIEGHRSNGITNFFIGIPVERDYTF
jgi:hypothetical protein